MFNYRTNFISFNIDTLKLILLFYLVFLFTVTDHINYHASILFLTAMSIDRCLATKYLIETRVHRTRKNATRASLTIWLVSFLTGVPFMLYSKARDGKCQVEFPGNYKDFESESELEAFIRNLDNETNFKYEVFEGSINKTGF